ncbi:MAG: hypothetical protein ACRD4K_01825 [Candidatus Acidiferrales bacterium]
MKFEITSAAAFLLLMTPVTRAQSSAPPADSSSNPPAQAASSTNEATKPYGDGQKGNLNYSGPSGSRNFFLIDLTEQTAYNDNVIGGTTSRVPDTTFFIGPDIWLQREGKHSEFALHYQPDFLLYAKTTGYDTLQQQGEFDGQIDATPHLSFRGRASGFHLTGIMQSSPNTDVLTGLGPPSTLNRTLFTPLSRETGYASRVDVNYQFSKRSSISFFGGISAINFDEQATFNTQLLDTQEETTGMIYGYRLSRYDSIGFTYLLSYYEFGPDARTLVHNPTVSYTHQFSPNWAIRLYGGPAFVRTNNELSASTQVPTVFVTGFQNRWDWTAGGDLSVHRQRTAVQIGAHRNVSDGGGLLTTVIATDVIGSVRHKLGQRLDAIASGTYSRNRELLTGSSGSLVRDEIADVSLEYSPQDRLALRWGYNFTHQVGTGAATGFGTLNRNIAYFTVMFRVLRVPLGQ